MWNSKGYTLVELLAVIVIMGILAAIAVPVYGHIIDQYREDLCEFNRMKMARSYEEFLAVEAIEHSSAVFVEFIRTRLDGDVCPVGGELAYVDGEVECSIHKDEDDENDKDKDDGGIPFL